MKTKNVANPHNGLMGFMKKLRTYFKKNYPLDYVTGSLYSDDNTITYFPFTPKALKAQKLKIAIVFNHTEGQFEIWLAAQNKQIQKQYWLIFTDSDWNKYHIPTTVDEGFSIVDHVMVENPNFDDFETLKNQIEAQTIDFIEEIEKVLA